MAFSYNKKNLANTTITGAITPTQTSVTVADATVFSYAFFYATLMPSNEMSNASNSEIVLVTNIQGNTLTLVRGQENTIARSFPYGAVITNGIYTRDIDYARSIGRKVFMARDDGTDDTNTSYQITDPMIKNVPEEGSIITVEFDTPSYGAPTLGVNNGIGGLVQVSGSNIHITDSSGQIDSVEMYGDTEQQTYTGKNLYPLIASTNSNGITYTQNADGTYNISGTSTAQANAVTWIDDISAFEDGQTYTISVSPAPTNVSVLVEVYNGTTWLRNGNTASESLPSQSKVLNLTNANRLKFTLRVENGRTVNLSGLKVQFEKGSSATSFEPYVGGMASPNPDYPQEVQTVTGEQTITVSNGQGASQVYPINLGKNLFDKDNFPSIDGFIRADNYTLTSSASNKTTYIKANPNTTYTFSGFVLGVALVFGTFNKVPALGDVANVRVLKGASDTTVTITTGASDSYIAFMYKTSSDTLDTSAFQIEKGPTATTYAPYFTPIELCKIGTYQDYIYKSGEDWYVHKETNKINLDGSTEGTWWYESEAGHERFIVTYADIATQSPYAASTPKIQFSNCFEGSNGYHTYTGDMNNIMSGHHNNHQIIIRATQFTSLSAFTTWLGTNKPSMYYVKATPTDTQITNSALIAQLDALYNMLPEGVADVVVTGDLPGSLTIKYYQQGTGTYTAPIVGGAEIDGGDNEQVVELDSYLPYRLVYDTNGYWRVLNKGPKVTTGAIADGAVTAAKITRDNINYGTTSGDIRIGTFDGKPLWRRVQRFTNIPTGYSVHNWTAGTIANLNSIVAVNGMWAASGSTTYVPINSLPPDAVTTYGIAIRDFTASSWAVVLGTSMSTVNSGYIILDYTKTS